MCKNPAMSVVRPRRHRVAVLALDEVIGFDLGTAPQVLGAARDGAGNQLYSVRVATPGGRPVRSVAGYQVLPEHGLEALATAQTVIVPGVAGDAAVGAVLTDDVRTALRDAAARGARMVSICTGAFALAAAGILDERPATTHWRWAEDLQRRYPRVNVVPNRLFVDDGDVLTSAGVTTGIDLCLHIIRRDHGAAAANSRARALVAPPLRQGGQAQFVERLRPEASGDQLAALRDWMLENMALPLDLDTLARHAHMSRRTLTRRFRAETGVPPMAWLADARIDRARELLEITTEPVEKVGRLTGLGAPASVRAAFHRRLGISPQDYRSLFRHNTAPAVSGA